MPRSSNLSRLGKAIRRHMAGGWQRAVFAVPGDSDAEPELVEAPQGPPTPDDLDQLVVRATAAAEAGRVKQTFVLDARTRVRIDARHGKAKVQHLDEATVSKVMGGKDRPLRPDKSNDLLRVIGIMNADGSISAKHAKKYKQVNHFVELCRPVLDRVRQGRTVDDAHPFRILDLGCGNAYLTFVLVEALRLDETPARVHGVDVRTDVIERSVARAKQLGWDHVTFSIGGIADADPVAVGGSADLVIALHACDTATDDALALAVSMGAQAILVAPCCQHELAGQLQKGANAPTPAMLRHGLFKQEYAALLTDALRVELLDASGYKVDVVEFVASEHTAKNVLLRATRRHPNRPAGSDTVALATISERCEALGVDPHLLRRLRSP